MNKRSYIDSIGIKLTQLKFTDKQLFAISFVSIFLLLFFKYPSLSYKAEVWAETGSNFFVYADQLPLLECLMQADAGYLPLLPRIVSILVVQLFGIREYFPITVQLISLCFVAGFASILTWSKLRILFPNDLLRLLLSISIAALPAYELFTFINFSYFAIIPTMLMVAIDKSILSYRSWFLLLFAVLCGILSKATFIILLPPVTILFIWHLSKGKTKEYIFYGLILLACLAQLSFILMHVGSYATNQKEVVWILFDKSFYALWLSFSKVICLDKLFSEFSGSYFFRIVALSIPFSKDYSYLLLSFIC